MNALPKPMTASLTPITQSRQEMRPYLYHPFAEAVFEATEQLYLVKGYHQPWIGYFALRDNIVVGVGGFKGQPKDNIVELAYATVPEFEGQGVAHSICKSLVKIAHEHSPRLGIRARTLPQTNASTHILQKAGFTKLGEVQDPDDGPVWEWEWQP
ncbi:MAG: GNAT family N-acetyltransferase [Cyclobacteriaceae bacterium]|nr:GNAT family N-acetyltransferase [Cyclobacteriaceae bacterium]